MKKYKGEVEGIVKAVASRSGLITYGEILTMLRLPSNDQKMLQELADLLGEISKDESELGAPLISVIVVNKGEGKCGDGFYRLAERLGVKRPDENASDFFIAELRRAHSYWRPSKQKEREKKAHA